MAGIRLSPRIALVLGVIVVTMRGSAQVIPSSDPPPGPRTGMIVGQVVDATTGAPISDAIVVLTMPKYFNNPTTPKGRVMADGEGRFFFTDLPAGEYYVQATVNGYALAVYGQRHAGGQNLRVSLGENERRTDVTLRAWKHAVIGGTVVDEVGEPVVGVAVQALRKHVVAGRTQYGDADLGADMAPSSITDDRGMFRLSDVLPGTSSLCPPRKPRCPLSLSRVRTERSELICFGRVLTKSRSSGNLARSRSARLRS